MKKPLIPTIALVGRANVGKSTLFNRLLEARKAIVSAIPGTTRDRQEGQCIWRGQVVRFLDTGGVDMKHPDDIEKEIIRQSELAREEADIIALVLDGSVPLQDADRSLAEQILALGKPFFVIRNKVDAKEASYHVKAYKNWPYGTVHDVSAVRGTGIGDLLDLFYDELISMGKPPAEIIDVHPTRVTVVGKPNVGKSTLLNSVLSEDRFITSPRAHTTREANDTTVEFNDRTYTFVDTAGIRKRARVKDGDKFEQLSVRRAHAAIKRSDVSLFVLEAKKRLQTQEKVLAGKISESDAGAIIIVNKWDLVDDKHTNSTKEYAEQIQKQLPMLKHAPILFVSALTGQRTKNIFSMVDAVQTQRYRQLTQEELDDFLAGAMKRHKPVKGMGSAPPKILGLQQVGVTPPRFEVAIKSRRKKKLHGSYVRYLENQLRLRFNITGTPIRVYVRAVDAGSSS